MATKNKGGRPRLGAEVKRAPMSMKTSPELRARIEDAAAASGLSMAQEVERRLIDSFEIEEQLGGRARLSIFRMMAWAIGVAEGQENGTFEKDYWAFHRACGAINGVLQVITPPLPVDIAEEMQSARNARNSAIQHFVETSAPLAARFPHQVPPNALSPSQEWVTVPQRRFAVKITDEELEAVVADLTPCLLYTSPSPRDS